jgi:ABC-type nitrate/sulfonate/bicarbonate transport system permease component
MKQKSVQEELRKRDEWSERGSTRQLQQVANYGPAIVLIITLLALWEIVVRAGGISAHLLPAPSSIGQALWENWDTIWGHTLQTLLETVLG